MIGSATYVLIKVYVCVGQSVHVCTRVCVFVYIIQWNLSIVDTIGTQLAVLYTVEPLYGEVSP